MREKYGKSYEGLLKDWERFGFEIPQNRKELQGLRGEVSKAAEERETALAKTHTTEQKVDAFLKTRDFLTAIGISFDDAEGVRNVLSNMKGQNFNPKRVVFKLKKTENLDRKISEQQGQLAKGEALLEEKR